MDLRIGPYEIKRRGKRWYLCKERHILHINYATRHEAIQNAKRLDGLKRANGTHYGSEVFADRGMRV